MKEEGMLYPRTINLNGKEVLVNDDSMRGYKEHMTQKHRVLFLSGVISGEMDSQNLLLALDSLSHDPIKLVITSPGGDLDTAFLMYDTIKLLKSPIWTLGRYCASAAAIILAAGEKRFLMPHAKTMIHQVWGQVQGVTQDINIQHAEINKYQNQLIDIFLECGAKRTRTEICKDIERDYWMEPKETIDYGLADKVMGKKDLEGWLK